jgi:hypothetical protein
VSDLTSTITPADIAESRLKYFDEIRHGAALPTRCGTTIALMVRWCEEHENLVQRELLIPFGGNRFTIVKPGQVG